jgi:hypothetical protein
MKKNGLCLAVICVLAGCAEQQVTENSKYIAITTDSFTKGQVLANIGKFIEDAGALPAMGHLKGGTAQVQNSIGFNFKYPYTRGVNGTNLVEAQRELDITPASYATQDSENWDPIVNVDDVARLRCLYTFAIDQARGSNVRFDKYQLTCDKTDATFRFLPPNHKWFGWSELGDADVKAIICDNGSDLRYYDTSGGHKIYACQKELSDFSIDILGETPNTSGGTKTVLQTSTVKVPVRTQGPVGGGPGGALDGSTVREKTVTTRRQLQIYQAPLNSQSPYPPPIIPAQ